MSVVASVIEIIPPTTVSADGQSVKIPIPTLTMIAIGADYTASTGVSPELTLYLQGTDDQGTTWYDIPYDQRLVTTATDTDTTADLNQRNIVDEDDGPRKVIAIYKHVPFDFVRLAWIIGGSSSPTFTFSSSLVGK